jgi:hypothetical protein
MIRSLDTGLIAVGPTLWLCSLNGLELSAKTHLRVEVRYTVPRSHCFASYSSADDAHYSHLIRQSFDAACVSSRPPIVPSPVSSLPLRGAFGCPNPEKTASTYTGIRTGHFGCLDELFWGEYSITFRLGLTWRSKASKAGMRSRASN